MNTKLNITREKGDTKKISITLTDKNGKVIPVTGWTSLQMTIDVDESPINDNSNIAQTTGSIVGTGITGQITFPCLGTIPAGNYYFEMTGNNASGERTTFASGKYVVTLHGKLSTDPQDPLELKQGEEFYIGWRFKWPDGSPKDLTGYTVKSQLKLFQGAVGSIATFTDISPEFVMIRNLGAIDLHIPASQTLLYNFKQAVIDCYVTNGADGDRSGITTIILKKGVTS